MNPVLLLLLTPLLRPKHNELNMSFGRTFESKHHAQWSAKFLVYSWSWQTSIIKNK